MNLVSRRVIKQSKNADDELVYAVKIHDRMIDVCTEMTNKVDQGTKKLHRRLPDSYIPVKEYTNLKVLHHPCFSEEQTCRPRWDKTKVDSTYVTRNLYRHLVGHGFWCELLQVLCDARWTMRHGQQGEGIGLEDFRTSLNFMEVYQQQTKMKSGVQNEIKSIHALHSILRDS